MKLYKVHIKTYLFGIKYYDLFVLAETENDMLRTVAEYPSVHNDDDAEIINYKEIDLNDKKNRVL